MAGPGDYVADLSEGVSRAEDLPPPRGERRSRDYRRRRCPFAAARLTATEPRCESCTTLAMPAETGRWTFTCDTPNIAVPPPTMFQRRHGRHGPAQVPLHPPRPAASGAIGDRGRPAVSGGQLAPLARPPRPPCARWSYHRRTVAPTPLRPDRHTRPANERRAVDRPAPHAGSCRQWRPRRVAGAFFRPPSHRPMARSKGSTSNPMNR